MDRRRIAILGMLALVIFAGVYYLLGRPQPEIVEQKTVEVVAPPPVRELRVLVAARDLARGEAVTLADTRWTSWPEDGIQDEYITSRSPDDRDLVTGGIVRLPMVAGEPVLSGKIARRDNAGGVMSVLLGPGMRAVTTRISAETASGGFILPGDRVDIYFAGRESGGTGALKLLYEAVRVLAVDNMIAENAEVPFVAGSMITLEMTPGDAARFIKVRNSSGTVQIVLRSLFEDGDVSAQGRREIEVYRYGSF